MGNSQTCGNWAAYLSNQWVKEEVTGKIFKKFEMNENKDVNIKNWDAAKVVLRGKFIAVKMPVLEKNKDLNSTI